MADCTTNCINEHRLLEIEKDIQRNTEAHRDFYDRFEKMNGRMVGYEKDMTYLTATITDISNNVKEIKEKPAKRWDTVVACALTALVSAIITFLLSGVLPM